MPSDSSLMRINTDQRNQLRLHEQIGLVAMPRSKRRRVVRKVATEARKASRLNIKQQRTIHGDAMEARRNTRVRRKMLRGLGRNMKIYMRGSDKAEVTWPSPLTAKIADRHQRGVPEQWTAGKARKVYGVPDYSKPATKAQAKALIEAGYRLRVRKKKGKGCSLRRVSQKWIRENLSLGQAGVILRMLRDGTPKGVQRWEAEPPARPFHGFKPGDEDKVMTGLARQAISEIRNR